MSSRAWLNELVDDRPQEQVFRVSRRMFTDPEILQLEIEYIFERTWSFVGLESQIAEPNEFVTTFIGRQPVILMKDSKGKLGCFFNTCRHRGTLLCPFKHGRQKFHVCRYHGWSYDSAGRNITVTDASEGQYPPTFDTEDRNLVPVARLESYRGLIFASLSKDVPPLHEYLGDSRIFIDLMADQSPVGQLEFVPGHMTYTFDANWKLQFENGLDYYHFVSTHGSYIDICSKREIVPEAYPSEPPDEVEGQGSFNFVNGHAVNWSVWRRPLSPRPLSIQPEYLEQLKELVGPTKLKWMLRQRNLTIFPNLQVIDISSAQLRTWRPLSVDKTEMASYCLAPVGESSKARQLRIRNYEDFFNPSGLATSDDNVMYEFCQSGYAAQAGATFGHLRGLNGQPVNRYAAELDLPAEGAAFGTMGFGGETNFHPGYREWRRLIEQGLKNA